MLPKGLRLAKDKDIRQTIRFGKLRKKGPLFSLAAQVTDKRSRIAVVLGKKIGNAVVRNRIKRVCKAAFNRIYKNIDNKLNLVVFPTTECKKVSVERITAELMKALKN